jgi:tRNA(fMet)-specific endonuclease VapC
MNGKYLLDTNIIIALFADDDNVKQKLGQALEVFVSGIILGELYYGSRHSSRVTENITRLDNFAAQNVVLTCDLDTARMYGQVKSQIRAKGKPIPENDIWTASTALQYGLTLVTRDEHFSVIDNLTIETW